MRFITLICVLSFSISSYSSTTLASKSQYLCKSSYEDKLDRIDANRKSRNLSMSISKISFASLGFTLGYVLFGPTVSIVWGTTFTTPVSASFDNIFDREERIRQAYLFLNLAHTPEDEIKERLYNEFIDKKYEELKDEGITKTHIRSNYPKDDFKYHTAVNDAVDLVNYKRAKRGLSQLNYKEFQDRLMEISSTDEFCNTKKLDSYNKILRVLKRKIGKVE